MLSIWKNLSEQNKGIILVSIGTVLLLHTLGLIQKGLSYIIILSALYMIGLGLIKLDVQNKIMAYFTKK